jgi:hypothetical protein
MRSILNFFKKIFNLKNILKLLLVKPISTVLYIGYLPDWNRHWSAAFSILTSIIFILNIFGTSVSSTVIAYGMMLKFIYILCIAFFSVPIFKYVYKPENLDVITIDAFLAQILVFALSVPAIIHINIGINNLLIKACNSFLYCNEYIFSFTKLFLTLLGPYFVLRFFDIFEFWPTAYIFLYFKNSYIRLLAGLIPAIYASISIYLFCLLFFDLKFMDIIYFYKSVFILLWKHLVFISLFLVKIFYPKSIYIILKKIGIIKLLDKHGIINAEHYDIKYNLI